MCFVVAIIAGIFAFNAFMNGAIMMGVGATITSLFFILLMGRNILRVKALRSNKKEDKTDDN